MFNSPISKSQEELVHAARTATTDYIQNGTDLTEAVVKAASAIQPLTQEHVRRICEMTYHDAYERLFAEKTGMYQYVTFDPPDAIKASEMLDAIQMEVAHQPLLNKLASTQMDKKESDKKDRSRNLILGGSAVGGSAVGGALAYRTGEMGAIRDTISELGIRDLGKGKDGKQIFGLNAPKDTKDLKKFMTDTIAKNRVKRGLQGAAAGAAAGGLAGAGYMYATRNKEASFEQTKIASMPSKFQRMNTHELWVKAASGNSLPDHNPTRELQQVHRDLKDSISTVKSDLYSAEQNEKLAMIDMVKQAKAGLSAGHSMEQVLHAALSVVDATEPFMAKTAHDLCATIIEACADHQNSGFRKEALMFVSPQEAIRRGRENDKSGRSLLGKMLGNDKNIPKTAMVYTPQEFDQTISWYKEQMKKNPNNIAMRKDYESLLANKSSLIKSAEMLQEVNPNHPIPQKFKKLAEANIQRKHLEVTLDELNRNMNYFNEQLKNELFR